MSVEAGHGTEGPTVDTPCGQEQGDPCPQGTPDVVVGSAAPTMPARPTGAGTRRGTLVLRVFGAALIVIVTAIAVFLLLPRGDAAGAAGTPRLMPRPRPRSLLRGRHSMRTTRRQTPRRSSRSSTGGTPMTWE